MCVPEGHLVGPVCCVNIENSWLFIPHQLVSIDVLSCSANGNKFAQLEKAMFYIYFLIFMFSIDFQYIYFIFIVVIAFPYIVNAFIVFCVKSLLFFYRFNSFYTRSMIV